MAKPKPPAYSAAYGGIPTLQSPNELQGNMSNILNQAIPGYSGLTQSATGIIGDAMAGQVPGDVSRLINDTAASRAVASGMPGSNAMPGTLVGNRSLRDLGLTSLQRQDTGVRDLLGFLQGVSGTAAPTFGQAQDQQNQISTLASAPDPQAAAAEQERLYGKYFQAGLGGNSVSRLAPFARRILASGGAISVDPVSGAAGPRRF
jgi:hypothetical protein